MLSLREALVETPDGAMRRPLDWSEVSKHLRDRYIANEAENDRRKRSRNSHALYHGGGDELMSEYIDNVFADPEVKRLRKQWVSKSKYNNVLRRVTHERSTVYSEPATRRIGGNAERYQQVQRLCRIDERMRTANRWLNLHRDILIGFRVRDEGTQRMPVIDLLPPGDFYAIAHPFDRTRLLGIIIAQAAHDAKPDDPHWLVWTHAESFFLNELGIVLTETIKPNPFSRMPWILAHAEPPATSLLDATAGDDLVAAHLAVWFENVLLLKESKSANKQVIFQGDTANIAHGQPAESEYDLDVGENVTTTTVDRSMDLGMFRDTADHILERAAGNYGIPPAVLQHHGATSGHEIDLRRIPLRELRQSQVIVFREIERELAEVMSEVLAADLPELAFTVDGWEIDFAEVQTPQSEAESLANFETARRLSLTSTIAEIRRRNPDLPDDDAAFDRMTDWIAHEVLRNSMIEPLKAMNGSPSSAPERDTPAENGAKAQQAKPKASADSIAREILDAA